ncbi:MAG TPA: GNAT family N-acetyltransferase [Stenotrophomonas sp.]|uniref:GNAT family N-acetyltransferase n=1 Tax=Stenotrophomonas rhizophila TaxID=216778 RepID=UPI000EE7446D|nr:GNAT family protein [Stenotrophomonas rhizophila]UQY86404.1 GNAT family N-acetyltransferase [Stenotrophomonas rhizophila]HBZ47464.1 GNAT family N-acetyltransferase [Stenotrophomonas sp.]
MNHADWTKVPTLDGRHARLEPLQMAHIDGLRGALGDGSLSALWYAHVPSAKTMTAYVQAALHDQAAGKVLPFAVLDADGNVVGSTRYYALEEEVPRLSIGYTWYGPHAQRTGVNTEAKLMLLTHAFERLKCISVAFETSSHNAASRAAIARLGATQEGVLRNHKRHPDGSPRDTVVFSIIDSEWQDVKRTLQDRLDAHA